MTDSNSIKRNVVARIAGKNPQVNRPAVDIVIPFHDQYETLLQCYSAVMNYTPNQTYKIILVDDCSINKDFLRQFLHMRKKTIGISLKEKAEQNGLKQMGFAASVNAGIAAGTNPLVCVLHSDVIPENVYWLYHLQEALGEGRSKDIKFVSSRLTSPGTCNNYPPELLFKESNDELQESVVAVNKPLPWTCCLFNRKLFEMVGPLKEYPLAWYEDIEYYHRMKRSNYKQGVAMKSVVTHLGGKTVNHLIKETATNLSIMENNSKTCLEDIKSLRAKL